MLPPQQTVVGIDEHTALVFDLVNQQCLVMGQGCVTVVINGIPKEFPADQNFPISALGPFKVLNAETAIPPKLWHTAQQAHAQRQIETTKVVTPPQAVLALVEARQAARERKDWATADSLRDQISDLGWLVNDTPAGFELEPQE